MNKYRRVAVGKLAKPLNMNTAYIRHGFIDTHCPLLKAVYLCDSGQIKFPFVCFLTLEEGSTWDRILEKTH